MSLLCCLVFAGRVAVLVHLGAKQFLHKMNLERIAGSNQSLGLVERVTAQRCQWCGEGGSALG